MGWASIAQCVGFPAAVECLRVFDFKKGDMAMSRQWLKGLAGVGWCGDCVDGFASGICTARPRRFRRLFGVAKAQLATLPEVQTELKMTDEQKTRVAEINDQLGEDRRALWGTGFGRVQRDPRRAREA